jgi:hypothetical protein
MKRYTRTMMLASSLGLLAVALTFLHSRTVSAGDNGSKFVTLVCNAFTSNICTDVERVAPDGTLTPFTAPPPGQDLVVTDFTWKAASVVPGQVAFATLHHAATTPPHDVLFSTAVATPDGAAVAESHLATGTQFSDLPIIFVSQTPNVAIIQGYLVGHGESDSSRH